MKAKIKKFFGKRQKALQSVACQIFEAGISLEESVWRISDILARNPRLIFKSPPDSELLSQFAYSCKKTLARIVSSYNKEKGDGGIFLRVAVVRAYRSWRQRTMQRSMRESRVAACIYEEMPENAVCRTFFAFSDVCEDEKDEFLSRAEEARKKIGGRYSNEALICMALRSAFYLDDEYIDKIALACGMPPEELFKMVQKVKKQCIAKLDRCRANVNAVNAAYIMSETDRDVGRLFDEGNAGSEKFRKSSELQARRLRVLLSRRRQIIPPCRIIGEVMGIPQRRVEFLLRKSVKCLGDEPCKNPPKK